MNDIIILFIRVILFVVMFFAGILIGKKIHSKSDSDEEIVGMLYIEDGDDPYPNVFCEFNKTTRFIAKRKTICLSVEVVEDPQKKHSLL